VHDHPPDPRPPHPPHEAARPPPPLFAVVARNHPLRFCHGRQLPLALLTSTAAVLAVNRCHRHCRWSPLMSRGSPTSSNRTSTPIDTVVVLALLSSSHPRGCQHCVGVFAGIALALLPSLSTRTSPHCTGVAASIALASLPSLCRCHWAGVFAVVLLVLLP